MKRCLRLLVLVLAFAVGIPAVATAQDEVWDLNDTITLTDLGFGLNFQSDWVYAATQGNGIFFAQTEDDLAQVTDNDLSTIASDSSIQFIGTSLDELASVLGTKGEPTLEELADFVADGRGITEVEERIDIPVMSRRSLNVIGENEMGQGIFMTLWKQGQYAVAAILTAPDYDELVNVSYSWGQLLSSMRPSDTLPLGKDTIPLPVTNAEFNYPDGWVADPEYPNIVYELESDQQNGTSEGYFLLAIDQTLEDFGLDDDATLDDVVEANISAYSISKPIRYEEFMLLDQPAVVIRGQDGGDQYILLAQAIVDGNVIQIGVTSSDEDALDAFEPTFVAMLQTLWTTT
ncbi:MAG: hypothetical protein LCI00_27385 [Chloroflexi bacterium]|nr:hypothetical protein [Chloroflexota bacterium]MCC6897215.1 hypothetical protein [Anaerolineae bacterium]